MFSNHPRIISAAVLAAMTFGTTASAHAQVPGLPDLPVAPPGAVGEVLDPIEDLLEEITGPLGDLVGDVPLDNAVTLMGEDAVDAAIALSRITFETSEVAFIGRDDVFADTLSSVAGQGIAGAPLLLTQTDSIDERTVAELDRLGVTRIIVLGADQALSPLVQQRFETAYGSDNVTRVGGPSRIETAADLAAELAPSAQRVVMLRAYPDEGSDQSQAYADALSAGPLASSLELPSLLTTTDYLHPATEAYLESAGVTEVTLIGGESAIAPAVEQTLSSMGITVDRIAGDNRWATSILIAGAMGIVDASEANRIILTEGGSVDKPLWAAGFAAAAQGAVFESPVILADGPLLPPETLSFFADGLIANALRLSNQPLICNSFVDFLACETAALLMVGLLDEANALTGGALEMVLGPLFGPLAEALDGVIPGAGEMGPGLVGGIVGLIGVPGDDSEPEGDLCSDGIDNDADGEIDEADECEAAFAAFMTTQPPAVQDAVQRMVGAPGERISPSRQVVLIDVLGELRAALGTPVMTADPVQAAALVEVFDGITAVLASRSTGAPLDALTGLLEGVADLVADLADVAALGQAIDGLGVDASDVVDELTGTVGALLTGTSGFQSSQSLQDRYGDGAGPLSEALDALTAS